MKKKISLNISQLFVTGESTPCKSPVNKSTDININFKRKKSYNPNTKLYSSITKKIKKADSNAEGFLIRNSYIQIPDSKVINKWYLKGKKFTTLHNLKKNKPIPKFELAGKTHSGFSNSIVNPILLLRQKRNRVKYNKTVMSVPIRIPQSPMKRKNSSKDLQVDSEELSSWIHQNNSLQIDK